MAPPSKLAMEFGPLRDRKSNGSIVILLKSKDFGPLVSMSAANLAPLWKNTIYKTRKRSMTKKKRSSEILGDRRNFLGKCRFFFGKPLKKVVQKFRQKFAPPVSEVQDPLVNVTESSITSMDTSLVSTV